MQIVAVHEFLHGLGFISSWGSYMGSSFSFPSFINRDENGNPTSIAPEYIFNRLMSDTLNNVWLKTYAQHIRDAFNDTVIRVSNGGVDDDAFLGMFNQTAGGKVSAALIGGNGLYQTENAVACWYPKNMGNKTAYKYVMLYTPSQYSTGSSISHVNPDFYKGSSNFLMGPFAAAGVSLDAVTPLGRTGAIGEDILGIFRAIGYVTL